MVRFKFKYCNQGRIITESEKVSVSDTPSFFIKPYVYPRTFINKTNLQIT